MSDALNASDLFETVAKDEKQAAFARRMEREYQEYVSKSPRYGSYMREKIKAIMPDVVERLHKVIKTSSNAQAATAACRAMLTLANEYGVHKVDPVHDLIASISDDINAVDLMNTYNQRSPDDYRED